MKNLSNNYADDDGDENRRTYTITMMMMMIINYFINFLILIFGHGFLRNYTKTKIQFCQISSD